MRLCTLILLGVLLPLWGDSATVGAINVPRLPSSRDELHIASYIRQEAELRHIDPNIAVRIMRCESSGNPNAANSHSSARGLYQFTKGTWEYIGGGNIFDTKENIDQFIKWYGIYPSWWECR
jgi:soluble lytic murein transglycosylase-like protein